MSRSFVPKPRAWIGTVVISFAAWLVWRALRPYSLSDITQVFRSIGLREVALALVCTAGSFLCLSGSDALAVRYAGRRLAYRRIALTSFTSISIGHVLGFAVLSSGALRYRFYAGWGLTASDVARILLFCGTTVAVGITTATGVAAIARPALVAELFRVDRDVAIAIGAACLAAIATYLGLAAVVRRPLRIRSFELRLPALPLAAGQVVVGALDQLMVAAALHQMLTLVSDIELLPVAAAYAAANAAMVAAHVPGGLGVIEAVVLSLVPGAQVLGAVLAFRAVYFLVPFPLGCLALVLTELARKKDRR